jgi:hypothetical protein
VKTLVRVLAKQTCKVKTLVRVLAKQACKMKTLVRVAIQQNKPKMSIRKSPAIRRYQHCPV